MTDEIMATQTAGAETVEVEILSCDAGGHPLSVD